MYQDDDPYVCTKGRPPTVRKEGEPCLRISLDRWRRAAHADGLAPQRSDWRSQSPWASVYATSHEDAPSPGPDPAREELDQNRHAKPDGFIPDSAWARRYEEYTSG
jgi:hypothetical protein